MEVSVDGVRESRYWDFDLNEEETGQDIGYYQQTLAELLHKAVDRQMGAKHRGECALALSGGVDSRAILGIASRSGYDFRTMAYAFDNVKGSDATAAAAREFGCARPPPQRGSARFRRPCHPIVAARHKRN